MTLKNGRWTESKAKWSIKSGRILRRIPVLLAGPGLEGHPGISVGIMSIYARFRTYYGLYIYIYTLVNAEKIQPYRPKTKIHSFKQRPLPDEGEASSKISRQQRPVRNIAPNI